MPVYRLDHRPVFPPPERAEPSGLLAVGGDLSVERLVKAYERGIFPWYVAGQPILWWSPHPRCVLETNALHVSKSLRKCLRANGFEVRFDSTFADVIKACATTPRRDQDGTWITAEMEAAYNRLHEEGYAHCVETWMEGRLVGGIYGVFLGRVFFGESMFSRATNASKVAMVALVDFLRKLDVDMIDCQVTSDHLLTLGAREIHRREFLRKIGNAIEEYPTSRELWTGGGPCSYLAVIASSRENRFEKNSQAEP